MDSENYPVFSVWFFYKFILTILIFPAYLYGQIVLSEIMFDPVGVDYYDEFIEIYNTSDSDSIDLAGWLISDSTGVDAIIAHNRGTKLAPLQFGLILDPQYFSNSTTYDSLIPPDALILTISDNAFGSGGLSNSYSEPVIIISSSGDTVARYAYSIDNIAGHSDEKIDLNAGDAYSNWANSIVLYGTPGAVNSVSPKAYDLAITNIACHPKNLFPNETVTLHITVKNQGSSSIDEFQIECFIDWNHDNQFETDEKVGETLNFQPVLSSGDSVIVPFYFTVYQPGLFTLHCQLTADSDMDATNNSMNIVLAVGFESGCLVINEIMYSPAANQPEWIELYNPSLDAINLSGWSFSDSDSSAPVLISDRHLEISPGAFMVLAPDSLILNFFDIDLEQILPTTKWPVLNNDQDQVFLFDISGNIIDYLHYRKSWGGGSGVSLERIHYGLASNDSSNWGSCVDWAGGTPGRQNSIFVDVLPTEEELWIEPNPFSPDSDGRDDVTIISFKLPFNQSRIQIKIYDIRGRLIRHLLNNQPAGVEGAVIWDGKDDAGNICRMGIYIVFLEAIHGTQGLVKTARQTVVLAKSF